MSPQIFIWTALLSLLPVAELRGGIPVAVANGMDPLMAYFYCVFFNSLVAPIVYIFMNSFHKLFSKLDWYRTIFDRFVEKTRVKVGPKIQKYGVLGVALFVAIPLPITGAWTGTLGSWLFGLNKKKTMAAVVLGVCISGLIVSLITYFGIEALSFMIKEI